MFQQFPISFVFLCGKSLFLFLRILSVRLFQDDTEAGHTADAPQTVIDLLIKIDAQSIRQGFPRLRMVFIRKTNDAVQIEDDRFFSIIMVTSSNHFLSQLKASGNLFRNTDPPG